MEHFLDDDYDFHVEFRRFAETLQRPLRTYRMEFNIGGSPANNNNNNNNGDSYYNQDEIYTTTYSTSQFSTTKTSKTITRDSIDYVSSREQSPLKKISKTDLYTDDLQSPPIGSSVQFAEIRSHKRVQKANEGVGTENKILETPGIKDPVTGRVLTVGEAIQMRILDVRTGEIYISTTNERITLDEAIHRQLIDPELAHTLLKPGAAYDHNGKPLSLLEVIQKDILEAENGYESTEKRIKVTTTESTTMKITTYNKNAPKSIVDAISEGIVDPKAGHYRIPETGDLISLADAYEYGYLIRNETVKIKSNSLCLSDAIQHGLVDASGWVMDRNSGDKFRLDSAIANALIQADVREVVDTKNDVKITVGEALDAGILNAKTGRYMNPVTKEKLTFAEAKSRQLIHKPMTLKDVCDLNLLDKNGQIFSPTRRERLSILRGIADGVLDGDTVKSITKTKGVLLTLNEALHEGIILPEARYRDVTTGEVTTIPDAVARGLISSVSQKSIFNIDGFKDPYTGDFVSLNVALAKNVVRKKSGVYKLDVGKGRYVSLDEGIASGYVRPEVHEMLTRKVGIFDVNDQELRVIDLVYHDLIDPKQGYLLDPKNGQIVPLNVAIEQKLITPEGALLLSSLLNITLTTETVTKTVKRYVTMTNLGLTDEEISNIVPLSFTEACHRELVDERTRTYREPTTGKVYSVQQALNYGLLIPDTEVLPDQSAALRSSPSSSRSPSSEDGKKATIKIVTKSFLPSESEKIYEKVDYDFDKKFSAQTTSSESFHSEKKVFTSVTDFISTERQQELQSSSNTTERQTFEIPLNGWPLSVAIERKLFDPVSGMFVVPGTDRLVSFEECLNLQLINPNSVSVMDPSKHKKMTVFRALEKRIIDSTGHYKNKKTVITLKEAIDTQKVILEAPKDSEDNSNNRLIQVTKINGKPDLIEVSDNSNPEQPNFVAIKVSKTPDLLSPEPIQLGPGAIYDPSTALVIFTETGQSENILQAVESGKVDGRLVTIKDPKTNKDLTLSEAIKKGIVNTKTLEIKTKAGKHTSIIEAVKFGALCVAGAPLVAAAGAISSLKMVFDPMTGKEIPIELAVERGYLPKETLKPYDTVDKVNNTSNKVPMHTESISLDDSTRPSLGELTRARVTTEPKYKVSIGRASIQQSPEKPVVLQKMRKQIIKPKDAVQKGLIDKPTADLLEKRGSFIDPTGEPLTLSEAIETKHLDGSQGKIVDPQRGDILNLCEAMDRGILDPEGTNQILVPLAKSLSVPQLCSQGLIDPASNKIVHPETGKSLSLREAIVCEIVDPWSRVIEPNGSKVLLRHAIEKGDIDDECSIVKTPKGSVDLLTAVEMKVFDEPRHSPEDLPPAGMTFPVVVKRGLVDGRRKEVINPVTGDRDKIISAIDKNYIMTLPYPPCSDSIEIKEALKRNLIDTENGFFKHPNTGDSMPLSEAVDTGLLVIKPNPELMALHASGTVTAVTETVTSYHTVTTKTIELMTGYVLLNSREVLDEQTGEVMPIEAAKQKGIIRDELRTEEKFAVKEVKVNFTDALRRGLVDIIKGTYTDPDSGKVMSIMDAVNDGILETNSEQASPEHQPSDKVENLTIDEAMDIIYDEDTKQFRDPKNPERLVNLQEAMKEGIVDPKSIIYDVKSGKPQTLQESVEKGFIDPKTAEVKSESGRGINVKDAAKMGLLAVVGAPILAGMAVVDAVKSVGKKGTKDTPDSKSQEKVAKPIVEKPVEKVVKKEKPVKEERKPSETLDKQNVEAKLMSSVEKPIKLGKSPDSGDFLKQAFLDEIKSKAEEVKSGSKKTTTTTVVSTTVTRSGITSDNQAPSEVNIPLDKEPVAEESQPNSTPSGFETVKVVDEKLPKPTTSTPPKSEQIEPIPTPENIPSTYQVTTTDPVTGNVTHSIETLNVSSVNSIQSFTSSQTTTIITEHKIVKSDSSEVEICEIIETESDSSEPIVETIVTRSEKVVTTVPDAPDSGSIKRKPDSKDLISNFLENERSGSSPVGTEIVAIVDETGAELPQKPLRKNKKTKEDSPTPDKPRERPQSLEIENIIQVEAPSVTKEKEPESSSKLQGIKDAAKMGAMAVIGAPILAGMVAVDAVKNAFKESESTKQEVVTEVVTKHVKFDLIPEEKVDSMNSSVVSDVLDQSFIERLPLGDAIAQNKIVPKVCRIVNNGKEMPLTVQDSLDQGQISPLEVVEVVSPNIVKLPTAEETEFALTLDENLTPEQLAQLGVYDVEHETFLEPTTGTRITFQDMMYGLAVFDPNTIYVKDFKTEQYEPLIVALDKPLIDKHTGHMVDSRTGKKVPFFECIRRGWIIQQRDEPETMGQDEENCSLQMAISSGRFDPKSGKIVINGKTVSIEDALRSGMLDIVNMSVKDPASGEILPMTVAIERGIVDLRRGVLINTITYEVIELRKAFLTGYLLEGKRQPISLEAVVRKGLYNPDSGQILDTIYEQMVDIQESVDKGIVDPNISDVVDSKKRTVIPLQEALDRNIIDGKGKIVDSATGKSIALTEAIEKQMIYTKMVTWTLIEVLEREFYNPTTGKILNREKGNEETLREAIDAGTVTVDTVMVRDDHKEVIIPAEKAIELGLLDATAGKLTHPDLPLNEAFSKGYLLSSGKPITLTNALVRGLYDPMTGLFTFDGIGLTLEEAINKGEITMNDLIIRDPKTGNLINLGEAIRIGLVNPKMGLVIDPYSGQKMTLIEALERGILIPSKRQSTLPDAVFKGLYDPSTGTFSSSIIPEKLTADRAIKRGLIDPQSTIVNLNGRVWPFELAVENGTVDTQKGTVRDEDGNRINFREAFDRGILIEVRKPISLAEALIKGIYNDSTGMFMDPKTGKEYTIAEAIAQKLIDANYIQIRDLKTGIYKDISLLDAINSGLINPNNSQVKHDNRSISLKRAFDIGLLSDSKAPISIQRAIHQGIYDDKSGKILDPVTSRKITIHEAMRKFLINPNLPCFFREDQEVLLSLADCCREKLIDRREGVFKEPGSDVFIPLNEAMGLGLIVDIESAGFGLYETLAMQFYDRDSKKIIHPVSGRLITLQDACYEDIVSSTSSLVKNTMTGKYVRLDEAIASGIVDEVKGVYNLPNGNQLDLQEARHKGLIVSNQKLLSIEKAIRMQLYRMETGKFCDPSTSEYFDLLSAIDSGLIDPETTVFKDLVSGDDKSIKNAIAQGDVDVSKGRVLDPKSKRSYNFDVALNKGLLVTVQRPLTGRIMMRRDSLENLLTSSPVTKGPRDLSLDEAIKYEIINPETAVYKDARTGQFRLLSSAIAEGLIDLNKRASIDPKSLFFVFDPTFVVYTREPISFDRAVESNLLDLSTGKFKNPYESDKEYTLKDAIVLGLIDPESVLVKDVSKKKLLRLPEAFRKGIVDADKANVLDTATSKLQTLQQAVENGLVVTPKRAFGLLESIHYSLYNPTHGGFNDPFTTTSVIDRKKLTLLDAIENGLIDPTTTMVRDSGNSTIVAFGAALKNGLVDPLNGRVVVDTSDSSKNLDFVKAFDKGLLLPAEQRQAVIEKFALCEETLSGLLKWISQVEQKIATVGGPKERIDELRNQINLLKQIKEDIESQSRPVASCLEQVRQLVLTGGDVLSVPEVSALENSGRELRSRVDRAQDRTAKLLKRLSAGRDELSKLKSETDTFSTWLQAARRQLEDKERALSDLSRLSSQGESIKEFVSDVIAHQADLRFITMSAQKFVDECKDYLAILNDFRTTLPDRLPHIEPIGSSESPIRKEVQLVSAQYRDLLHRANALSDRVSGLGGKQKEYQDSLEKARGWLRDVQPRVAAALNDPVAAEPQTVQDQLNLTKALHNEFLTQGRLIDNAQQCLEALLRSLAGQLSPSEISALEVPIEELKDKYAQMIEALSDRCKLLDTALVQSQGVQDALDSLVGWVNAAEDKFKLNLRPASLIKERLQEQVREHRSLLVDLQSHRTSLDSVTMSAQDLIATASNARLAKKIETKLQDTGSRFEKLLEKAVKRGEFLDDTLVQVTKFNEDATHLEHEFNRLQEALDSRELASMPAESLAHRMQELARKKEQLRPLYEDCVHLGKELIGKRDVTDTGVVRDRVKALENQWRSLDTTLDEKAKLSKQKAEQLHAYESLREQVVTWLTSIERRVNVLSPVAMDVDTIKQQTEELRPLVKEHRDYGTNIDKVNDLGEKYDALVRPDSPTRKRSAYSPLKQLRRSPSPNKLTSPLSPGGSSGFGSRRSSQEGYQLTELSPVQQQLSEINNRYSLVGARLNDRQSELDSLRDEVKKHQENIKTLSNFLDKVQRQVPKDALTSKDEADQCNRAAKKILEEMYEKQSLLDSTRAQVKDLLKRKPDVLGADRLRSDLDGVADRWKNLNDLCKDRINFSDKLKDFLDTHDNLNSWLNAKERMLTVLGPISSDPRMVQTQVEQVAVLREEFRGQQPQLNHLQDVGHEVLENLRETSPEGQAISTKLRNTQNKWDDLVSRLDERASSLGAAADSSKEFDAGLNRLREALQNISDNLDALPTDRDHEENLRKIENLERQLAGQRPLLVDAEQAAEALCRVLGDPASRADVNARVGALDKQYQALQKKLDTRKAETEGSLRDGRQFAETCARTLGWLSGENSSLSERLLVSAHRPTLQHQVDTHEPIYREVMAREHEIIMLLNKGKEYLDKPGQAVDRSVQRDLDKIQLQWEKLRREAVDRHSRLQTCMEHCKKHAAASEVFLSWLRNAEDKLATLKPGILKKSQLDQQLKELQAFRSEVWKKSGEYDNTRSLGEAFLSACDVDKEPLKAELLDMRERWERLNNDLLSRAQALELCSKRLGDFNEELRDLDHAVSRCEDRLAAHDSLGGAAKDPKLLDRVKAIKEESEAMKKPLQSLKKLAGDIAVETRAVGGDADHLSSEVDTLGDRLEDLQGRLFDRCGELQSAATAVTQFNERAKSLSTDLSELERQVDGLSSPGREIKVVMNQLDEVAGIMSKIEQATDRVEEVERAGESLVDAGFAPDIAQTRDQVAGLRKTLTRLDNRTKDHEEALQKALKALQKFYDAHSAIMDDLKDVSDEMRKMKPVSSELEQIRVQQDDFRRFQQRTVEPLAQNIDEVNRAGQDLVRSAQGAVSTTALEKDLEKMNDRWNDLKEKMNERDRRLDVGLLQSGKFQEALDGLSKWLTDTEEMVANQKPPSADYKVVKAQLQEQKFLKKMLLDRQNSMSSLFNLGQEVAAGCDPKEKAGIERQLKELMHRFDALTDSAQQRTLDLEQAMHVAKQFQDKLHPLSSWLDGAERAVKAMEMVPTDEEKIQKRIHEHDRLHDEILGKQPDFSDLANIAGQLMELVGEDEGVALGEKVKGITDRYTDVVRASEDIGNLLNESRQGLRHLVLTYQDLVAWMEGMEQTLQRYRIVPVHTDKLLEQMDMLVDLNEDIASRAPNVESTVEAGSELMKHISSDEALQLKDKLDSLQRRYGELANKGGDTLKAAQDALPLVQQFHECHARLVDWMQGAEAALATGGDPKENDIIRLEHDLQKMRSVLEQVNQIGPQLCQISPGEGASTIEGVVQRDNRRFEAIVEQIQRKAERLQLSKQRSKEVTADIDELLEWFRDMDASLRDSDLPAMEPKLVRLQLQEHRSINDDISSQKGRARDVTSAAKKVLRETQPSDSTVALREKLEDLKDIVDSVANLCAKRLAILEQALPLSEHFADSHIGLVAWLDDMEHQISMLNMPALRPDQIAVQQDKNERLTQSINEHKPLLDKLNKTGEALSALVIDEDQAKIHDILESDNARYAALRTELRERQQALEQALQESSQFADKLEGMLRALANTADQMNHVEPMSAHPPKIRDQIEENAALIEDIEKRDEAYKAVKRAATDVISKASNPSDPGVRDIKKKLEKLNALWNDLQNATSKRGTALEDALAIADKFWKQLQEVMDTLRDLEETLTSQEPPAAQPHDIKKQQVALQEIRQEIDQTKPEVEQVRRTGNNLMQICGEPDKPEVKKHIEDLDHAWDNITALYAKREENLIDAMEKAMEFHETLQNLLKFLDRAETKFANLGPLGSDIDAVKKQIEQLKHFKDEVDPHMVEVEALNRQAVDLTERTSPEQAQAIRDPLSAINRRWDSLLRGMVDRQKQLEHALLHLGQFQHALNELLIWISRTDNTLDSLRPIPGDPQLLEVELAKLKVLANDIQAHQSSVDTLNDAGRQLIENDRGSLEASTTQDKLRQLNTQWRDLLQKASDRQHELEEALREAQSFTAEIQDLLGWLGDVDSVIASSKPVGGLPETASEQLERFMEVYNELEENRPKVETLLSQGQEYVKRQNVMKVSSSNLQHTLRTLKQRWDAVVARSSDKKIKLEIALKEATEFHDSLQAFVEWLTSAEKQMATAAPVSRVLETIQQQIEEHKVLQKDVSIHREAMLLLDKKGTHLKYFSQKQDVILIKNLLVSVQHRWERVVAKVTERTRGLDHGYKEAREFHDSWSSLVTWLKETETTLDQLGEDATHSKDPAKIKKHLERLRETQRNLSSKQGFYDATMRNGKSLIDRAPKTDEATLNRMLSELKETWTRVCTKSVDRQRKLEESLLLSGQFSEALQALLEWLRKAKVRLSEEGPVHGDLDTVTALFEQHKQLESDLDKRSAQMQSVMKTGKDLERSDDTRETNQHLRELERLWTDVGSLSERRKSRLQDALRDAERLHKSVHMLLEWLSEAEQKLRYAASNMDDEQQIRELLDMHHKFLRELREKERDKDDTLRLAHSILEKAHPDAVPIIKNWISIIQSRWEEISQWAINRESKLQSHLKSLQDLDESIEELLAWLQGLESTLLNLEAEPLPDEIPPVEELIADHKEFMENTAKRQSEIDRACKPRPPAAGTKDTRKPSKGRPPVRGSQADLRERSPDYGTLGRKQSFKSSRDTGLNRRTSRLSPGRETTTPERDRLPHFGPRFSPSPSVETELRSPRAKLLWDKWRHVWMMSWERQRRLHEHLLYLQDIERVRQFSWDDWRKRFLKFMNHKKSRLTDLFRKMDKDNNGLIPRDVFIDGIINTKFDTSRLEMGAVADLFDRNGEGLIDWQEFIAALRPDWQDRKPATDSDKIHDEVKRLVMLCTCRQKFRVFQVGEGKYRFGDSQKLRLVRILRSTVMVRVGGGWVALDEFLLKNDPCRVALVLPLPNPDDPSQHEACCPLSKGRTNIELREQFILADGVSQSMAAFKPRVSISGDSKAGSPGLPTQGPIVKVRERSSRSIAMSRPSRSSLSASTPDSLSDNEQNLSAGGRFTPKRPSVTTRTTTSFTPGGSRGNSKPSSRPASRAGSKPVSRHGSNLSLDSAADGDSPSTRIPAPTRRITPTTSTPNRPSKLSVGSTTSNFGVKTTNGTPLSRPRTPSGSASPAPTRNGGMSRSSSIPTLTGITTTNCPKSRIPVRQISNVSNTSTSSCTGRNLSGTSTPSGMQTPSRKGSVEPQSTQQRSSRGTTPVEKKAPFRL